MMKDRVITDFGSFEKSKSECKIIDDFSSIGSPMQQPVNYDDATEIYFKK